MAMHACDHTARSPATMWRVKFRTVPLFAERSLMFCSPFDEVMALEIATLRWRRRRHIDQA
ncbi:hypothetical protein [Bradyrhizobium liaoningense]|uniref:hypothetical protein n=1 Tax=Bradyrhizobium liaoningense TaxID=43992 RepID=UPI001BAA0F51|nr:hypothetical protein [Bradyrhizobium liaoningense]MBR0856461.1 hypothetical protein [Bradyrhizobium liaoningense]